MADQVTGILSPFLRRSRIRAALPYVRGRLLDYGCGIGSLAGFPKYDTYVGIDKDPESLWIARRKHSTLRFQSASAIPEGPFDTIAMLAVIEYLPDRVATLSDLRARLAPGGRLVITAPSPGFYHIRRVLAVLGLGSSDIPKDENSCIGESELRAATAAAGFTCEKYHRFLFGMNQLMVLRPNLDAASK